MEQREKMKKAIILFSGGKDSLLTSIRYLDKGYKVKLITYENSCGIDIKYPLENLKDDWDLKNELLMRGIIPKTIEPQCLLGCTLNKNDMN